MRGGAVKVHRVGAVVTAATVGAMVAAATVGAWVELEELEELDELEAVLPGRAVLALLAFWRAAFIVPVIGRFVTVLAGLTALGASAAFFLSLSAAVRFAWSSRLRLAFAFLVACFCSSS